MVVTIVVRDPSSSDDAQVAQLSSTFDAGPYRVFNSYHCSRLNTNTGRLTTEMFEEVFRRAKQHLEI